ncbi:Lipase A [Lasiodiplodia theobromae]|uniref:Lipase A n=1 Tax=Lasiodiplodia theobromae TaxID=45133 RepID=A0A5N5D1Q8_9PEZI|nr:Lipase A [Lasiodiplodia theobromae]
MFVSVLLCFLLGTLAASAPLQSVRAAAPQPPSQDPWYEQPANISDYVPGAIIRSRQVANQLEPFLPLPVSVSVESVHQYLFRTTDSLGNAVAAASTLIKPYNANPEKLLSYQTAYDSSNPDCSPSYTLQSGSAPGGLGGIVDQNSTLSIDTPFIAASLNQGWYVSIPDYEGLQAHFVAGLISGYATLDSIRAALSAGPTDAGLSTSPRYAMWGYSGGSLASEWAAELQPSYAPELDLAGTALGGLIANVTSVAVTINKTPFAGLGFSGIIGLSKAYPALADFLDERLIPEKKAEFFSRGGGCLVGNTVAGAGQDLFSYFINGTEEQEGILQEPAVASVLAVAGQMGRHGVPTMPLYVYKAVGDEVSPAVDSDLVIQQFCSENSGEVTIEYYRNTFGEHATELILGSANALGWIKNRLDGVAVTGEGTCKVQDVFISAVTQIDTVALIGLELVALLQTLLGGVLGGL